MKKIFSLNTSITLNSDFKNRNKKGNRVYKRLLQVYFPLEKQEEEKKEDEETKEDEGIIKETIYENHIAKTLVEAGYSLYYYQSEGKAEVNSDNGEIVAIDNTSILSTMTFCIDVSETAVENSEIEASQEFIQFNEKIEEYKESHYEILKEKRKKNNELF